VIGEDLILVHELLFIGAQLVVAVHEGAVGGDVAEVVEDRHDGLYAVQELHVVGLREAGGLEHQIAEIVGAQRDAVLLGNIVVGPDDERRQIFLEVFLFCTIRRALAHDGVVELRREGRLMVAEHGDDGRLVGLRVVVDQLLERGVGLIDQAEILLGGIVCPGQVARETDRVRKVVPAERVAAVVLHGHVENEGVAGVVFRHLFDRLEVALVGYVFADDLRVFHVLLIELVVEAQVAVSLDTVPAGGEIGVEGVGRVALAAGQRGERSRLAVHVELIGDRAVGQEGRGVAGQHFVFHIGGAAAEHGRTDKALDRVFLHAVDELERILIHGEAVENRKVGERLVHDDDDVDGLGGGGFRRIRRLGGLEVVLDSGDGLLGIAVRLAYKTVPQGEHEIEHKAVALGDPLLSIHVVVRAEARAEEHEQEGSQRDADDAGAEPSGLFLFFLAVDEEDPDQHIDREHRERQIHFAVRRIVVAGGDIGGGFPAQHVDREEHRAAEAQDIVVGDAEEEGHTGGEDRAGLAPAARDEPEERKNHDIPDEIPADTPEFDRMKGIVAVQDLYIDIGREGTEREEKPGKPGVPVLVEPRPRPDGPVGDGQRGGGEPIFDFFHTFAPKNAPLSLLNGLNLTG